MPKSNSMRLGYLGSVALIALAGAYSGAQAAQIQFGEVSLTLDNNLAVGISDRVASRNTAYLPESNGGPKSLNAADAGSNTLPAISGLTGTGIAALCNPLCGPLTGNMTTTNNPYAFAGSINADDGRLNYTSGDIIGAPVKMTSELTAVWRNYKAFVRGYGFYDFVLTDFNHGDRSLLNDDSKGLVGRDYRLLDAFISADFTFADMPLNIRVGKQVINWGESTFLLNGLNNFNPIDVTAYRRPGAEIKDILLPVNAIEGSISLPYNVSLAGYYALGWDRYRLDPAGSPFSATDVVDATSGFGGNQNAASFLSGGRFAGYKLNCGTGTDQTTNGLAFARSINLLPGTNGTYSVQIPGLNSPVGTRPNCTQDVVAGSSFFNYATPVVIGQAEATRFGKVSIMNSTGYAAQSSAYEGIVDRGKDLYPSQSGDFGLNVKYLMEGGVLDGYEFGGYYQNYSSRLPFVDETTGSPQLGLITVGNSSNIPVAVTPASVGSNLASRYAGPAGCVNPAFGPIANLADPRAAALQILPASDPQNLLNVNSVVTATNFIPPTRFKDTSIDPFTGTHDTLAYQLVHDNLGAVVAANSATAIVTNFGTGLYHSNYGLGNFHSIGNMIEFNCALDLLQSGVVAGLPMNFNGTMLVNAYNQIGLSLSYPSGIEQYGFSWAGTIGTWGIQGELTYRPKAPFQADTDQVTIAAVTQECAFVAAGNVGSFNFEPLDTMLTRCDPTHVGNSRINGEIFNSMYTGQVGSTATFTNSEWFVDAIGADLGIFVPEIGFVHVPGVEKTWIDNNPLVGGKYVGPVQYGNTGCQGSDLPLGGLLALDHKSSKECRPTDTSAGLVLLAITQYNNAFNTGFVVAPQAAFSWDFYGTTPAPYGNYMEGRMAVSLGVNGTLNNSFTMGVNYTNYFGAGIRNKSQDLDYVSASMGYSF